MVRFLMGNFAFKMFHKIPKTDHNFFPPYNMLLDTCYFHVLGFRLYLSPTGLIGNPAVGTVGICPQQHVTTLEPSQRACKIMEGLAIHRKPRLTSPKYTRQGSELFYLTIGK